MLVARAFLVSKYPSDFGLSTGRVGNAARNILTQTTTKDMLQYSSSSSMSQLGFNDGEVRSNLPFFKSVETVILLAASTVTFKRKIES